MSDMPLVAVVLSTYNGACYLHEQLASIASQSYGNIVLVARDDGSKDKTVEILESYACEHRAIVLRGENVGVAQSFLLATAKVPEDTEYVAFCDQDDVWHADKIRRGVEALSNAENDCPRLYFTALNACDEKLQFVNKVDLNRLGVSFTLLLYEWITSGNTCIINRALLESVNSHSIHGVHYHDWWIALIASSIGEVIYDDEPSLEYRRLPDSVSAGNEHGLRLLAYRIRKFLAGDELLLIREQQERFRDVFGVEIEPLFRTELSVAIDGGRLEKALRKTRYRQRALDEMLLRVLMLIGKL